MSQPSFAPYRIPPGMLAEEATRRAAEAAAEPLLVPLDEPLPAGVAAQALALVAAGRAGAPDEACRAADGSPSGFEGDLRACLVSDRHRTRVERAVALALELGFKGVCLDRPDAPLALGILGAGFCPDCQRALSRELAREYGEHFQPVDYLVARARGARAVLGRARLRAAPVRPRLLADARRDGGRGGPRAGPRGARRVAGAREAVRGRRARSRRSGRRSSARRATSTRRSSRCRRSSSRPAPASSGCSARRWGGGPARRSSGAGAAPAQLARIAAVGAACGVDVVGDGETADRRSTAVRRFAALLAQQKHAPPASSPVHECAVLYSPECDLWSGGSHREQVERAVEALAALHVQAPVVLRVEDAPANAALVLAGARALPAAEARAVLRRVEAGGALLAFGSVGAVDEAGRKAPSPLPSGKSGGVKVGKGVFAELDELPAPRPGQLLEPKPLEPVTRALGAVLGKARRAAGVAGRAPLLVVMAQNEERLDVHLVTLAGPAQGATLFVGLHVAGGARRARFQSAAGQDEKIVMNPSGYSLSTVLPAFEGYAVLSLPG